jgi:hypothetical protein
MKRDLLSLQITDQFPGSINRDLIPNSEQNPAIAFDRLVDPHILSHIAIVHFRHRPSSAIYDDGSTLFHGETRTP